MRTSKLSGLIILCICVVFVTGCADDLASLRIQNSTQRSKIGELESETQTIRLKLDQVQRQLDTADARSAIEQDALGQKNAAFEKDIGDKKALIGRMQQQLLYGGVQIPVELSAKLEDFSKAEKMVSYDADRGVVKFKSDLLFEKGSDVVTPAAKSAVESLCKILNTAEGSKFDIIIAGHTDDMRISRAGTRKKHPSNWHLSAHRAISVLRVMSKSKVASERLSVRGFGEYKPIAPNKPGKKGNPQNRRVEIYIVAKGV